MTNSYEFHPAAEEFPLYADDRLEQLIDSIEANGLRHAIVLSEGKILDGRNRYRACQSLGIEPETVEYVGDPYQYVWDTNGERRDLTDMQRALIRNRVMAKSEEWQSKQQEIRAAANRKRAEATKAQPRNQDGTMAPVADNKSPQPVSYSETSPRSDALARHPNRVAKAEAAKVSPATMQKAEWLESKSPALATKVIKGEMKAADAIREVKRETVKAQLDEVALREVEAPTGLYDVLVIDPPWPMEKIERDERPNQVEFDYPTMTEAELADLEIPSADDCHVWLWTTQKFLPMAFRLLDRWGMKYVCTFVWHKSGGPQPYNLPQYNCEFAIYARKGSPQFLDTKAFFTCFEGKRGRHSEKPEEFYEILRRVTGGRRLDMFNRRKIEGFDGYGKEVA